MNCEGWYEYIFDPKTGEYRRQHKHSKSINEGVK